MTQPLSKYRQVSRTVLDETLAGLPVNATRKDAERALRGVYPGAERMGWAYACWLKERKAALDRRWPPPKPPKPTVRITSERVTCTWCSNTVGGCIACIGARGFLVDLPDEACSLLAAAEEDPGVLGVWLDWLAENGLSSWSSYFGEAKAV